ncbi:hypothetical protein UlMin_029618, partial [Ulmus minor]
MALLNVTRLNLFPNASLNAKVLTILKLLLPWPNSPLFDVCLLLPLFVVGISIKWMVPIYRNESNQTYAETRYYIANSATLPNLDCS